MTITDWQSRPVSWFIFKHKKKYLLHFLIFSFSRNEIRIYSLILFKDVLQRGGILFFFFEKKIDQRNMSTSLLLTKTDVCIWRKEKLFWWEKCITASNIYIENKKERSSTIKPKKKKEEKSRRKRTGMLSNCLSRECITTADFVITTLVIEG